MAKSVVRLVSPTIVIRTVQLEKDATGLMMALTNAEKQARVRADLGHLDFRRLSNRSGGTVTQITAKIRTKMAAPILTSERRHQKKNGQRTPP